MLKIGDVLTLEHQFSNSSERYKCKLVEKIGNDLYIDYPINIGTGKTVYLLDRTPLRAVFASGNGGQYYFQTEIKGRKKQGIPMLILSFPGEEGLVKIQRRQYVRVETSLDVSIQPFGDSAPFTAVTDDISAGGAAILASQSAPIKPGMTVSCLFVLPMQNGECEYKRFKGKVIRVNEAFPGMNRISVQFVGASGLDRQLLLRFCFERQLELRKKGLPV
ncbi:flagellar brake domain-containing protein [Mesobacillus foraminis]|uniref:flagellar brake protein n=1 Tax=Mesobacillus foraminis TaxID=279826 RepID=UPI001BE9BD6A|nr:flagellar brake domain-containing protein [Mesobacillus foraminis]MBT2754886.1 flagellar brake domain-containing protein [Mesobacillus foraminis]